MRQVRQTREQMRDELALLRDTVSCIVVLEQAGYRLDKRESSRNHQKFRRGEAEIVIVTHEGHGWWSPCDSHAKGKVVDLVLFLNPSWTLGNAVQELRRVSGIAPLEVFAPPRPRADKPFRDGPSLWRKHDVLRTGSLAWTYLAQQRALPDWVLQRAVDQGVLKEGVQGTAWFAHTSNGGDLTGMEMRGPSYRGFSMGGGGKKLFRYWAGMTNVPIQRLVVCEAAIDALSYAAMDPRILRIGTLYISTAGGMSAETLAEFEALVGSLLKTGAVIAATDADAQGDRYADTYASIAQAAGKRFIRHRPDEATGDWNSTLQGMTTIPEWTWPLLGGQTAYTTQDLELKG